MRHRLGPAGQLVAVDLGLGVRFAPYPARLVRLIHRLAVEVVAVAVDGAVAHDMAIVAGGGAAARAQRRRASGRRSRGGAEAQRGSGGAPPAALPPRPDNAAGAAWGYARRSGSDGRRSRTRPRRAAACRSGAAVCRQSAGGRSREKSCGKDRHLKSTIHFRSPGCHAYRKNALSPQTSSRIGRQRTGSRVRGSPGDERQPRKARAAYRRGSTASISTSLVL